VDGPLVLTTNRLTWENVASTHGADDRRTLKMLDAAVFAKHDVLGDLDRHPAEGAARQITGH
jgi:hypothetical protein